MTIPIIGTIKGQSFKFETLKFRQDFFDEFGDIYSWGDF